MDSKSKTILITYKGQEQSMSLDEFIEYASEFDVLVTDNLELYSLIDSEEEYAIY